ncbi:hypothetical protein HDU96_010343 [Phlyctochytrium bullatum]|nr:hypothetical protein HDU96_010343 [Phlyctochytrium bullatum]
MLITGLATEAMIYVAQYLLPSDLLNLSCASRQFQTLISSEYVWQRMVEQRFPEVKRPIPTQGDVRLRPIVFEHDYANISLCMIDHSDFWKSGLLVAAFSLKKRSSSTSNTPSLPLQLPR